MTKELNIKNKVINAECTLWNPKAKACSGLNVDENTGCYKGVWCPFKKLPEREEISK